MSSDLFLFDGSFFTESFFPFSDDILQAISNNNNPIIETENPVDEINSLDQIAPGTNFSSSPPSHQLEHLSLYQTSTTHLARTSNSANGYADYLVKREEPQNPLFSSYDYSNSFGAHSYGDCENAVKMMQRSYSGSSFDGKPGFVFQPRFSGTLESPNFNNQVLSSPENGFSTRPMRRVYSTGDLQNIKTNHTSHRLSSSPLGAERSFMEEANSKVGRYSAQERKERIHRYRAKRNQRNFHKTIKVRVFVKYACRKTLADNRPRIRGRFARNDETGDIPKAPTFNRYEDEDDLWIEGFNEEDDERTVSRGPLFNSYNPTPFQYYGY